MAAGTSKTPPDTEPDYAPKDEDSVKPEVMAQNQKSVDEGFWGKMGRYAAHVPFAKDALALYYCARDPQTPMHAKGILLAALAYFILPTDAMPDLLPVLGFTDDAAVVALAIAKIRQHLKPEHNEQAEAKLEELKTGALEDAEA
ncbi:MAG: YkvA family protein [Pseudomonadota bacterium]